MREDSALMRLSVRKDRNARVSRKNACDLVGLHQMRLMLRNDGIFTVNVRTLRFLFIP